MSRKFAWGLGVGALALLFLTEKPSAQAVLKLASTLPPNNVFVVQALDPWIAKINAAAGSEFKIEAVHGPTIANAVNVWERTAAGVVQLGWGVHGAVNLPFPKSSVTSLPLLVEEGHLDAGSAALWRLYASGLAAGEYKDVRPVALVTLPVQGLSSKTPIRRLEDVRGVKFRATDKTVADLVTALGGSPISVPAAESYQALAQGVVTASIANWIVLGAFRLGEVTKEHVQDLPLGAPPAFLVMNKASFESLSPKGKQIFESMTGEAGSRELGALLDKTAASIRDTMKAQPDQKFSTFDPDERKRWVTALEGVIEKWAASTPDGRKVLDQFKSDYERGKQSK